jgi:hypothetical protein
MLPTSLVAMSNPAHRRRFGGIPQEGDGVLLKDCPWSVLVRTVSRSDWSPNSHNQACYSIRQTSPFQNLVDQRKEIDIDQSNPERQWKEVS